MTQKSNLIVYYDNIEQNSEEWHELRRGKMTASNATAIGANGAGLVTYTKELVLDRLGIITEPYINSDIERGNELEEEARQAYEFKTGVTTKKTGFITNSIYKNVGCSPDAIINEDGGLELKARNNLKHLSLILGETKEIPFNQIQLTLLITERKWWDFASYNPNFSKPLFITRILPDEKYFEKLKNGIERGNELINEYMDKYKNYK